MNFASLIILTYIFMSKCLTNHALQCVEHFGHEKILWTF